MPTPWPTRKRALRDERSFASVAEEHLDDVYRYLLYMTGNPHLAEDLAAETFERALRRWRRFDPRRGAARTWLCQLARGAALDHFRADRRRRKREGVYASDIPDLDEPVFGEGLSPALDRAVRSLSAAEQHARTVQARRMDCVAARAARLTASMRSLTTRGRSSR